MVYALSTINGFHYYKSSLVLVGIISAYEIMMNFIPKSPRWLIANGQKANAIITLTYLRGPECSIETELEAIENDISSTPNMKTCQLFRVLYNKKIVARIFITVLVMFWQQISGLNAASSYATLIFKEAGVANPSQAASYAVGSVAIVFTILAILIVDRIGRKVLLLVSGVGMFLGTVMLGTHFYITRPSLCEEVLCNTRLSSLCESNTNLTLTSEEILCNANPTSPCSNHTNLTLSSEELLCNTYLASLCENNTNLTLTSEEVSCSSILAPLPSLCANHTNITLFSEVVACNTHFAPLAIVSLMLFFAAFSIGWGPVPWILLGELIPMNVRGFGTSLATFTNWGTAAIVVGFYFNYSDLVNPWFSWWTFSVFNLISIFFVIFFVPETKGKNLEEISKGKIIPHEGENLDKKGLENSIEKKA